MEQKLIFIKHLVGEMGDDLIQRCIICDTEVCNYQNVMVADGAELPKGWVEGELYITKGTNPTLYQTDEPIGSKIINCNDETKTN